MTLKREEQARVARHIISIDKLAFDNLKIIEQLSLMANELLELSGYDDNGVAFDLSEYLHEKVERLRKGEELSDGTWESCAFASLKKQL